MRGADIVPGETYAILPWRGADDDRPIREGTAVEVLPRGMLAYTGSDGRERTAHLSRVAGPWRAHTGSQTAARVAVDELYTVLGSVAGAAYRVSVVETGYAAHAVVITLVAVEAAHRLVDRLRTGHPVNADGGA